MTALQGCKLHQASAARKQKKSAFGNKKSFFKHNIKNG
jgi:hypothetical protein